MNQIVSREMSKKENIIEMIGFCANFLQSKAPLGDIVIWHQGTQRNRSCQILCIVTIYFIPANSVINMHITHVYTL